MNQNKLLIVSASLILAACAAFAGDVATHSRFVPKGTPMVSTGIATEFGDEWVIVDEGTVLPPEAPVVDPAGVEAGEKGAISSVFGALGGLLPAPVAPFAPFAGYLMAKLLGKRNRQNWGAAIASAAKGNVSGAIRMAAAAEGIVHTTEDPDELMAVAKRKKAIAEASGA